MAPAWTEWDDDERNVMSFLRQDVPTTSPNSNKNIHKEIITDVKNLSWDEVEYVDYSYELLEAEYLNMHSHAYPRSRRLYGINFDMPDTCSDDESSQCDDVEDYANECTDCNDCNEPPIQPQSFNDGDNGISSDVSKMPLNNPDLLDRLVKNPTMYS